MAVGYREFIEYIVLNDDISELGDNGDECEFPSVIMSACSHLFNKPMEEVIKSLRNKRDALKKQGVL